MTAPPDPPRPGTPDPARGVTSRVLQARPADRLTRRERRELEERGHRARRRAAGFAAGLAYRFGRRDGATGGPLRPLTSRGSRGALLVARLHAHRLWRSGRHQVAAGIALVLVYALLALGWVATGGSGGALLGLLAFAVLTLLLGTTPTLGAAAIGADRDSGVLPVLQLTRLSAADLVIGAWLAGAAVGLLGILGALPALAAAAVLDASGPGPFFASVAVLVATAGVGAALGVAAGASSRRRNVGTALAVGAVAAVSVGTLIVYALLTALTPQTARAPVRVPVVTLADPTSATADEHGCAVVEQDVTRYRGDRVWPVLAANPFVALADSLGGPADPTRPGVLSALSDTIRATQAGPSQDVLENCPAHPLSAATAQADESGTGREEGAPREVTQAWPVWPPALLAAALATPLCLWWARRRLHTPQDKVGAAEDRWAWPGSGRRGAGPGGPRAPRSGSADRSGALRRFGSSDLRLRAGRRTEPLRRRLRRRPAGYGR